jgi:energy-coupling factor transporter transmembrane protein EcfT
MRQFWDGLKEELPTITRVVVIILLIALVIFLFTTGGGTVPFWFQAVMLVTIVVLLGVVAVSSAEAPNQNVTDVVPVRVGVILLGVIVVACVAGLIQVINNPPQVVGAQVVETTTPSPPVDGTTASQVSSATDPDPGETTDAGETTTTPGVETTTPGVETTTTPNNGTVANTANLGLSGQIVSIFGTIAAGAVGGIAGLLTQRR